MFQTFSIVLPCGQQTSKGPEEEKYEKAQLSWFMDYILGL